MMNKKVNRTLILIIVALVLLNCDITITKDDKYTKINNVFSVIFTDKSLIEKGINNK